MMNLYNFIKLLYGFLVSTFAFIISSVLLNTLGGITPKFSIYIITIVFMLLLYYMINKTNKFRFVLIVHNLLFFLIIFILYGRSNYLSLQGIVIIQDALIISAEGASITRDYYKRKLKGLVAVLVLGMFFSIFATKEVSSYLYSLYILFFFAAILLLRASRSFQYKLASSKKVKTYILIFILSLILFNPYIYTFCLSVFWILYSKLMWILVKLLYILSLVLTYPVKWLQLLFHSNNFNGEIIHFTQFPQEKDSFVQNDGSLLGNVLRILPLIFIMVSVLYIFKIILSKRKVKSKVKEQLEGIEREKLKDIPNKNYNINRTNWVGKRGRILEIFYNIERDTYKKNLFKKSMTANQLLNISKPYLDNDEEFKVIVDNYNEAKFSTHEIGENLVKETELKYKNVKKQIKLIKNI